MMHGFLHHRRDDWLRDGLVPGDWPMNLTTDGCLMLLPVGNLKQACLLTDWMDGSVPVC